MSLRPNTHGWPAVSYTAASSAPASFNNSTSLSAQRYISCLCSGLALTEGIRSNENSSWKNRSLFSWMYSFIFVVGFRKDTNNSLVHGHNVKMKKSPVESGKSSTFTR